MKIIRAGVADAPPLSAIALAAKGHWGYPARWLEQWREVLTVTPQFVAGNETYLALEEDEIVGFHALIVISGGMSLEHLWLLPIAMGRGFGRLLFTHAAERAAFLGAPRLTIEADPNAEPFYLHLGAVRTGTMVEEIEGFRRELPVLAFNLTTDALRALRGKEASDRNSKSPRRSRS